MRAVRTAPSLREKEGSVSNRIMTVLALSVAAVILTGCSGTGRPAGEVTATARTTPRTTISLSSTGPGISTAAGPSTTIAPGSACRDDAPTIDPRALNQHWVLGFRDTATAADPTQHPAALGLEFTAGALVWDDEPTGAVQSFTATPTRLTIGPVIQQAMHLGPELDERPAMRAVAALFAPGTMLTYRVDGDRLTVASRSMTAVFTRNGPPFLAVYYPQLSVLLRAPPR